MTEDLGNINEIRDALAYLRDDYEQWKKIKNQLPDNKYAKEKYESIKKIRDELIRKLEQREYIPSGTYTWRLDTGTY